MKALITGITGQDGSYLAELLLSKDYEVYGLIRRSSVDNTERISSILAQVKLISGDMLDSKSLETAVKSIEPDEVYNLAAQSFVHASWGQPMLTTEVIANGTLRLLEAVRCYAPNAKFYQASSSEMFGKVRETPQSETTAFYPRSPYGTAKAYAHHITINYRESYGLFACCGILFNHESPRRGMEFVTRKIVNAAVKIHLGLQDKLSLGNLDAKRDWGEAQEYTYAMWLMLQQEIPDDFVIATGKTHTVKEFVEIAFESLGLNWQNYYVEDKSLYRPAEVDLLCGDASKAKRILNWQPLISFETLVQTMVDAELRSLCATAK